MGSLPRRRGAAAALQKRGAHKQLCERAAGSGAHWNTGHGASCELTASALGAKTKGRSSFLPPSRISVDLKVQQNNQNGQGPSTTQDKGSSLVALFL